MAAAPPKLLPPAAATTQMRPFFDQTTAKRDSSQSGRCGKGGQHGIGKTARGPTPQTRPLLPTTSGSNSSRTLPGPRAPRPRRPRGRRIRPTVVRLLIPEGDDGLFQTSRDIEQQREQLRGWNLTTTHLESRPTLTEVLTYRWGVVVQLD